MAKKERKDYLKQIIENNLKVTLSPYQIGQRIGNWFDDNKDNYYQISTVDTKKTNTLTVADYGKSYIDQHYSTFFKIIENDNVESVEINKSFYYCFVEANKFYLYKISKEENLLNINNHNLRNRGQKNGKIIYIRLDQIKNIKPTYFFDLDVIQNFFPEEILSDYSKNLFEGAKKAINVNAYERNPEARKECIKKYGTICCICGFDFKKVYGKLGEGFIHIHHIKPISEIGKEYKINPINDLRPVCPNCHAMLHIRKNILSIEELKNILSKK